MEVLKGLLNGIWFTLKCVCHVIAALLQFLFTAVLWITGAALVIGVLIAVPPLWIVILLLTLLLIK